MNTVEKKIISIGGGGFTHQTDKIIDEFVINQKNDRKIKFGFLPTASKDNANKIFEAMIDSNESALDLMNRLSLDVSTNEDDLNLLI